MIKTVICSMAACLILTPTVRAECPLAKAKKDAESQAALTSYPEDIGPVFTVKVAKMRCGSCANKISKRLSMIDGVKTTEFNIEQGLVHLTVENKIKTSRLIDALQELGYPAVALTADEAEKSVADSRPQGS